MKKICVLAGILISLVVTGIVVNANHSQMQEDLAKEVFRFHVLANSDSKEDQELKLKVKEEIISYMKEQLPESESVGMTKEWTKNHLKEIKKVAETTLAKEGSKDQVKVGVTNCYFPDKTYGDITFPRGNYDALRIEIGAARGQNWWCVLYPNLCFIDAVHAVVPEDGKEELKQVLDEEEYQMVTATSKFKIRWFFFR